jgi:hypothetical protein
VVVSYFVRIKSPYFVFVASNFMLARGWPNTKITSALREAIKRGIAYRLNAIADFIVREQTLTYNNCAAFGTPSHYFPSAL